MTLERGGPRLYLQATLRLSPDSFVTLAISKLHVSTSQFECIARMPHALDLTSKTDVVTAAIIGLAACEEYLICVENLSLDLSGGRLLFGDTSRLHTCCR